MGKTNASLFARQEWGKLGISSHFNCKVTFLWVKVLKQVEILLNDCQNSISLSKSVDTSWNSIEWLSKLDLGRSKTSISQKIIFKNKNVEKRYEICSKKTRFFTFLYVFDQNGTDIGTYTWFLVIFFKRINRGFLALTWPLKVIFWRYFSPISLIFPLIWSKSVILKTFN